MSKRSDEFSMFSERPPVNDEYGMTNQKKIERYDHVPIKARVRIKTHVKTTQTSHRHKHKHKEKKEK